MRPVLVVMVDVVDNEALELLAVPADGPVEEFASKRADPALGEGVGHWCSDRGPELMCQRGRSGRAGMAYGTRTRLTILMSSSAHVTSPEAR